MLDEDVSSSENFWKEYLSGSQKVSLPPLWQDSNISSLQDVQYESTKTVAVPDYISDETLLTAWTSVLSTYTLTEDIVFGVTIPGDVNDTINAARTLPFRVKLSQDDDLNQVSQCVRDSLCLVLRHAELKLAKIKSIDSKVRTACEFGSLLLIRPEIESPKLNGDIDSSLSGSGFTSSESIPIVVSCQRSQESTRITLQYQVDLYVSDFAHQILNHFLVAINQRYVQKDILTQYLAKVDSSADRIKSWTYSCEPIPADDLLHSRVEEQARKHPLAIAIGQSESVMTYSQLNVGADLLAQKIMSTVQDHQGDTLHVAICSEKSPFAILSMLAILKAGGAYVPLDIDWPDGRISTILEDAEIRMVICSDVQRPRFKDSSIPVLTVNNESIWEMKKRARAGKGSESERLQAEVKPTDTAYMLYTSGSTGRPKGISISHRAIATSVAAMIKHFDITAKTRTFQCTSFTFDLSVGDIWITLSQGGRLCLPTEAERSQPGDFIIQEHCDYAMITPSLTSTIEPSTVKGELRTLSMVGEIVSERLLLKISPQPSSTAARIRNSWGPTEACVIASSSNDFTYESHLSAHPSNIGHPVGSSIFIVSPSDPHNLAPAYAPGEIALVGHTLATSYYGNPEKTAEAFRTDLKWTKNAALIEKVGSERAMEKVYLTGDIGRYNQNGDGTIIFMHRKEGGYVKVNGYRIDPGEVETGICEAGNNDDQEMFQNGVCVLVYERPLKGDAKAYGTQQVLTCFFVAGDGQLAPGHGSKIYKNHKEVRQAVKNATAHLGELMPEYMIPSLFIPIDSMPLTTSQKVDRNCLLGLVEGLTWEEMVQQFGS